MSPAFVIIRQRGGVDLATVRSSKAQPGALKEDALDIRINRDGGIFFGQHRVALTEITHLVQLGISQVLSRRYIYEPTPE